MNQDSVRNNFPLSSLPSAGRAGEGDGQIDLPLLPPPKPTPPRGGHKARNRGGGFEGGRSFTSSRFHSQIRPKTVASHGLRGLESAVIFPPP